MPTYLGWNPKNHSHLVSSSCDIVCNFPQGFEIAVKQVILMAQWNFLWVFSGKPGVSSFQKLDSIIDQFCSIDSDTCLASIFMEYSVLDTNNHIFDGICNIPVMYGL
jgi:hypothetical protein